MSNISKHKISFETAINVFNDTTADIGYDDKHSLGEDRFWIVGKINNHFLFVIYTIRRSTVRIISARLATKGEVEHYFLR